MARYTIDVPEHSLKRGYVSEFAVFDALAELLETGASFHCLGIERDAQDRIRLIEHHRLGLRVCPMVD